MKDLPVDFYPLFNNLYYVYFVFKNWKNRPYVWKCAFTNISLFCLVALEVQINVFLYNCNSLNIVCFVKCGAVERFWCKVTANSRCIQCILYITLGCFYSSFGTFLQYGEFLMRMQYGTWQQSRFVTSGTGMFINTSTLKTLWLTLFSLLKNGTSSPH